MYEKERELCGNGVPIASAPSLPVEEASAPLPDNIRTISSTECVICLDLEVRP